MKPQTKAAIDRLIRQARYAEMTPRFHEDEAIILDARAALEAAIESEIDDALDGAFDAAQEARERD
jgi:hypothetical protein